MTEKVFLQLLAEQPQITVLFMRQFDALPQNVEMIQSRLAQIDLLNRESGKRELYRGNLGETLSVVLCSSLVPISAI